jgi:RNA polymerase sigma-70 factor, ECF subfamily
MSPTASIDGVQDPSDLNESMPPDPSDLHESMPPSSFDDALIVDRAGVVSRADAASFYAVRRRLFGIAYRMLGNVAEADEVVQDTWIRWQRADRSSVRDAAAFLTTATARLALNAAQSARARHETLGIECLPEPVDPEAEPALHAARNEELGLAVSVLLERLAPSERAAFVLRKAFDYPYRDIAKVLGVSEENARQLVTRARGRLSCARRSRATTGEKRELLEAISVATHDGDLAGLERLLSGTPGSRRRRSHSICTAGHRGPSGRLGRGPRPAIAH